MRIQREILVVGRRRVFVLAERKAEVLEERLLDHFLAVLRFFRLGDLGRGFGDDRGGFGLTLNLVVGRHDIFLPNERRADRIIAISVFESAIFARSAESQAPLPGRKFAIVLSQNGNPRAW